FHSYLISQTGYQHSKYFHSYIQILLGLAIVPLRQSSFIVAVTGVLAIYVVSVLIGGTSDLTFLTRVDAMFLKTYVIMSFLLYYKIRLDRKTRYKSQFALELELLGREQEIKRLVEVQIRERQEKALVNLAEQVAHDVRSPLAALEVALRDLSNSQSDTRL